MEESLLDESRVLCRLYVFLFRISSCGRNFIDSCKLNFSFDFDLFLSFSPVLVYVPTIYVCLSNLVKSLERGYTGLALRSFSTILIPFPFMQTLIWFVTFKILRPKYLTLIKPTTKEEKLDLEEMKAEIQMAGTFYNSCPSICLQVLISMIC